MLCQRRSRRINEAQAQPRSQRLGGKEFKTFARDSEV